MKSTNLSVLLFVGCTCIGFCDDTAIEKQRQLDRYFEAVPVKETIDDSIERIAVSLPPDDKKRVMVVMTRYFDLGLFKRALGEAMLKNLNANEIKALADFYGSINGKSAQKKLASALGESLPILLIEFERANALYEQELKSK